MRKLVLKNSLSLGDIVVLTAAVRDLHRCYPGQFLTDVRTSCGELWMHNPLLTPLDDNDPDVESLYCEYPLIQWCNQVPCHMVYGFADFLNLNLGLEIKPTELRGDIHLSPAECNAPSPLRDLFGLDMPYWLVAAGGKHDVTVKWWDPARYQQVVDHFRGRIQFVQVGGAGDFHPKLRGAVDLRGKTRVRDLVHLVHHAQGVLCGVTGLMHLAAAVPVRNGGALRPCVVVAGGREPVHWESYPGHQFIHTIGALPCCASGGCWKSRTVPLGDNDKRDDPANLCPNLSGALPRCMDMIGADEVIRRIELYFAGKAATSLNQRQAHAAQRAAASIKENAYDALPLNQLTVRPQLEWFLRFSPPRPKAMRGRGLVISAANVRERAAAWLQIRLLRNLGCRLPVQLWLDGAIPLADGEPAAWRLPGVELVDARRIAEQHRARRFQAREMKLFALRHARWRDVLLLDPDVLPEADPTRLFAMPEFHKNGAVFWPGDAERNATGQAWRSCGFAPVPVVPAFDTAVMLVDRRRCWTAVALAAWMNGHADFFHTHTRGDSGVCQLAWHKTGACFAMPAQRGGGRHWLDFKKRPAFSRLPDAERTPFFAPSFSGYVHREIARQVLSELPACWSVPPGQEQRAKPSAQTSDATVPQTAAAIETQPPAESLRRIGESLTLVTLFTDEMAPVGRITSQVLRDYAQRHGYACHVHERSLDTTRHPSWSKLLAVRAALAEKPGAWVMWIDADAVVVNHRIRAETLVPKGFEVVFGSDFNGLNSGIFLIRGSDWSLRFLETVFFLGDLNHDPDGFGPKWDQNTFKYVLKNFTGFADRAVLLPQNRMSSSLDNFTPGDFILHFGAMPNGERLRHLQTLQKWTVK